MTRGLLCCEISPFVLPLSERFKQKSPPQKLLKCIWRFEQGTRMSPKTPQARYPILALPGWNNLRFLLMKIIIHGSAPTKTYLYHNTAVKMFLQYSSYLH